jgi:apolipoprotein N-acyltransferase
VAGVSGVIAYVVVERGRRARAVAALAAAAVLALVWAHGAWRLRQSPPEAGRLRVGLVQASILQDEKWDAAQAWRNVERHMELTRRAGREGAKLVVWPESAVPFLFDRTPVVAEVLRRLAADYGIHLLFGNDDREDGDGGRGRIWVGAKMIDPEGRLVLRYHKMRLVPFGEYVPMQSLLTLGGRFSARLVQEVGEFTPGTDYAVGAVDGHPIAVFICYEAIFPDMVRGFIPRGAQLLVNVTNDAWYGHSAAARQHGQMAQMRAAETARVMLRATNTGVTSVIDEKGRVLAALPEFTTARLDATVEGRVGITPYVRWGNTPAIFIAVLGLAVGWRSRRRI